MKSSHKTSITILFFIVLWIASGAIFSSEEDKKQIVRLLDNRGFTVRLKKVTSQDKIKTISIRGITKEHRRVDIKAEVGGKVTEIPVREGALLKKGDLILKIETRDKEALLKEAKALVKQRKIEYEASKKLSLKGFQAETKLAEAAALLEGAKANVIRTTIDFDNTFIRSPFDGVIEEINVEVGDIVGPNIRTGQGSFNDGNTIATVVERNPFLVIGNVSERNIKDVSYGTICKVGLSTGQKVEGKISFIGTIADPLTHTFRTELEIDNTDGKIVSGVTSSILIPLKKQSAHHIPISALSLNKEGSLGIKVLEKTSKSELGIKGTVTFHVINIFDTDSNGIWALSLPDEFYLISIGHAFVHEGDRVLGSVEN